MQRNCGEKKNIEKLQEEVDYEKIGHKRGGNGLNINHGEISQTGKKKTFQAEL